jgi:hypothetical protein
MFDAALVDPINHAPPARAVTPKTSRGNEIPRIASTSGSKSRKFLLEMLELTGGMFGWNWGRCFLVTMLGVVYRAILKQPRDVSHGHSSFSILWIAAWIFRRSDRESLAQTTLNRAFRC